MPDRPIRICLILHSSRSDNLGVGALTASEVAILRGVAADLGQKIEITICDWKDDRAPYVTGDDIQTLDLDGRVIVNPFGYFRTALRSDMVIDIGGGDSFADIYGPRRLNRMFALKFLTHLAGTPLVMAPQTIGPFTRKKSRFLARLSMRLCRLVATRDRKSTEHARDLRLRREIIEASDVALVLPYDKAAVQPSIAGPIRVGINVSGLLMNGGYTGRNEFGLVMDYPALIRRLITTFQSHDAGCEVHLVPHVIVPGGRMADEDDLRACESLASEFPGTVMAPAFGTPSEAKTYIAQMDFFMGARMHACIAAFSSGVPVVPMAYSRKFAGLFGSIGYDRTVDCTAESAEDIEAKIYAAFEDRAVLAAEGEKAMKVGLDKLQAYRRALQAEMGRLQNKSVSKSP